MNKGYAKLLKQIIGNPIHSVDKYHLFQEANRVVDEVRQISIWGLAMNFITLEDIPKLGKKIGKKLTQQDIQKLKTSREITEKTEKGESMKKYKDKRENRLQAEQITKESLVNSK
tara:strand:- start:934 stop:1278 length:345 start_codon:yes stop_codon:yes gene_type:complete